MEKGDFRLGCFTEFAKIPFSANHKKRMREREREKTGNSFDENRWKITRTWIISTTTTIGGLLTKAPRGFLFKFSFRAWNCLEYANDSITILLFPGKEKKCIRREFESLKALQEIRRSFF